MSIHLLKTTDSTGRQVDVRLGWDRPLHGFHLTVTRSDAGASLDADLDEDEDVQDAGDAGVLYSNVADFELLDEWGTAVPPDIEPLLERLAALGISLPPSMVDACLQDQVANAGNRVVQHELDGSSHDLSLGSPERPRG